MSLTTQRLVSMSHVVNKQRESWQICQPMTSQTMDLISMSPGMRDRIFNWSGSNSRGGPIISDEGR